MFFMHRVAVRIYIILTYKKKKNYLSNDWNALRPSKLLEFNKKNEENQTKYKIEMKDSTLPFIHY